MKYKTQKSVIQDYQNGNLDEASALVELQKIIELQRIKRQTKKLVNKLNKSAEQAQFVKPHLTSTEE